MGPARARDPAQLERPGAARHTAGTLLANIGGPIFVTVMPVLAYRGLGLSVGDVRAWSCRSRPPARSSAPSSPRGSAAGSVPAGCWPWSIWLHSVVGLGILAAPALPAALVLGATLTLLRLLHGLVQRQQRSRSARPGCRSTDQAVIARRVPDGHLGRDPGQRLRRRRRSVTRLTGGSASSTPRRSPWSSAATVIALVAIPLAGLQPLLDRERPAASRRPSPPRSWRASTHMTTDRPHHRRVVGHRSAHARSRRRGPASPRWRPCATRTAPSALRKAAADAGRRRSTSGSSTSPTPTPSPAACAGVMDTLRAARRAGQQRRRRQHRARPSRCATWPRTGRTWRSTSSAWSR